MVERVIGFARGVEDAISLLMAQGALRYGVVEPYPLGGIATEEETALAEELMADYDEAAARHEVLVVEIDDERWVWGIKDTLPHLQCLRCGHEWMPRSEERPGNCPKCKSPYWDKPRKRQTKE